MTSPRSPFDEALHRDPGDFSLVLGGPLYQLLRRAHVSGDALELVQRRTIVAALLTWLPLLGLAALEGNALGTNVAIPFVKDLEVHVRFLVALPLLIVAELVVHQRMRPVARQFLERELVPANATNQLQAALAAAFRLRNSVAAELGLIAFVYAVGVPLVWRHYTSLGAATWYATPSPDGVELTLSGIWYAYVSLPLFQFLLLRWLFRVFIWARFLWHVSRIELRLVPTHPDRVGGLGFLSTTAHAFVPLAAAHGAMLAAMLANRIFYLGASLLDFRVVGGAMLGYLLCLVFGPLLVFTPSLAAAKRKGLQEYGALAASYVRDFDAKWLRGGVADGEPIVGSADIQSLADLGNSFALVKEMRLVPISRDAIVQLTVAMLAPISPLLLTMMSLGDLIQSVFSLVL